MGLGVFRFKAIVRRFLANFHPKNRKKELKRRTRMPPSPGKGASVLVFLMRMISLQIFRKVPLKLLSFVLGAMADRLAQIEGGAAAAGPEGEVDGLSLEERMRRFNDAL